MIEINKHFFDDKPEYEWLKEKLEDDFNFVLDDKPKIIYGFNGVGKSSFCNCLKLYNETNNFSFLDYETENQKYNGDSITISTNVFEIEKLKSSIERIKIELDFAGLGKQQGYTKTNANKGPDFLKSFVKSSPGKNEPATLKTDVKKYQDFINKHLKTKPAVFFKVVNHLNDVVSTKDEIENFKKNKFRELLEQLRNHISEKDVCPVCGSSVEEIETVIDKKIKDLSVYKSAFVTALSDAGSATDSNTIDEYISLFGILKADNNLLNDYAICGNSITNFKDIETKVLELSKKEKELSTLIMERNKKYSQIKIHEDRFKMDTARYLGIDEASVVFDDSKCEITISLGRDAETYSTGERHILWFLVELYSFLGSDSAVIILDDPVSSLDLTNLYKIAFEIVRNIQIPGKTILVFTHSSQLINAINSQYPGQFGIYYLEEFKNKIYCDEINYKQGNVVNVIDTERFSSFTPKLYLSLKKRDYDGNTSDEHNVYHYSLNEVVSSVDGANLTNHKLVKNIDDYTSLTKTDFYKDSFNKVLYILSLRVWVEKCLYELIPSTDSMRQSDYLSKHQLQEKISIIANKGGRYADNLFETHGINKEELLCKKVMLNQNAHYYSQIMPFAFAINLSLDDVDKEIKEVKLLFHK